MSRPIIKWLLFASCLAVFLAAMSWISARTLEMERQREIADKDAQIQERVRLALWRMDSVAGTLVVRENARPASHYQSFIAPDDLFSKKAKEIRKGEALMPSPLLGALPEFVLLHFEISEQPPMTCISPQVPTGQQLQFASNWYAISPQVAVAGKRLEQINTLLRKHGELGPLTRADEKTKTETRSEPKTASAGEDAIAQPPPIPAPIAPEQKIAAVSRQEFDNTRESIQRNTVVQSQIAQEKEMAYKAPLKRKAAAPEEPEPQMAAAPVPAPAAATATPADKTVALADVKDRYKSASTNLPGASYPASAAAAPMTTRAIRAAPNESSTVPSQPAAPAPANLAKNEASQVGLQTFDTAAAGGRAMDSIVQSKAAPVVKADDDSPPPPGDLAARWIDNELLLTRPASLDSVRRTQGIWIDWPALQMKLLETIRDLLPAASLTMSATPNGGMDPLSLASLPVRLLPGGVDLPTSSAAWSPLRRALAIAWACFAFAALAIGLVLNRAIVLSERRGAFVSAVTHELRTPLTTFRLYSEMLADDMIPSAEKRREYLRTLCDESTRLTHLVENVLAYSRIERGRTAARMERISIGALIARIEPRLRKRCEEVGLDLKIALPPDADALTLETDPLAIEQILFNLTDNAAKYAAPASSPRELHLSVASEKNSVIFRIRDHGPGISREQMKKLFHPFSKSATEAAHSAPGVGLGLALCKRLAVELGAVLRLESNDSGACFAMILPSQALSSPPVIQP